MDATRALLAAAAALAMAAIPAASAIPPGALSLEATGYAAIDGGIEAVRIDLVISPRPDDSFTRAGGLLIIGTSTLDELDIEGAFTRDSREVQLSGTAQGRTAPTSISLDGRLADERGDTSAYLLTGTLERNGVSGRAAFAALLAPAHSERDPGVTVAAPPVPERGDSRSLRAAGYAAVGESIEPVRLNLAFTEGVDGSFSSSGGTLGIGGYALDELDVEGAFTRADRFVSVSGTAAGRGDPVSLSLLGRISEGSGRDTGRLAGTPEGRLAQALDGRQSLESAYLFTGTLERAASSGKAVLAALVSRPASEPAPPPIDAVSVRLLPAPRVAGAPPGHFDEPVLRVKPGQNVTIANADAEPHRLVSGTINDWFYERDGKPRTCSPDGTPDEAAPVETRPGAGAVTSTTDKCDFTRDARVDATVRPGESRTIHIADTGIYRMLDPAAPWIQLIVVSVDSPGVRCPPHCH